MMWTPGCYREWRCCASWLIDLLNDLVLLGVYLSLSVSKEAASGMWRVSLAEAQPGVQRPLAVVCRRGQQSPAPCC